VAVRWRTHLVLTYHMILRPCQHIDYHHLELPPSRSQILSSYTSTLCGAVSKSMDSIDSIDVSLLLILSIGHGEVDSTCLSLFFFLFLFLNHMWIILGTHMRPPLVSISPEFRNPSATPSSSRSVLTPPSTHVAASYHNHNHPRGPAPFPKYPTGTERAPARTRSQLKKIACASGPELASIGSSERPTNSGPLHNPPPSFFHDTTS